MSEQSKDDIIKKVYTDKSGFGSALTTYRQILEQDERAKRNSGITQKDVKEWFYQNVENTAKPRGANSYINNAAYEEYQMDHIFFGRDKEKNLAITMIDIFSKYAVVIPMKGKTKENVLAGIMEGITKMGKKPKMLYCDRDTTFTSNILDEWCKKENIKLIFTTTHPMVVERFNRTFKNMIWKRLKNEPKVKTGQKPKTWKDFVTDAYMTYNSTVHTATNMKPIEARQSENTLQTKINLEMHRHSTRTYKELNVGDNVKIYYKKPPQKNKENVPNWSEDKYRVLRITEEFGQKYYYLEGQKKPFLRHDLLKVP